MATRARSKPTSKKPPAEALALQTDHYQLIDFELLVPAPDNVRDELGDLTDLADSIAAKGILQPLLVRDLGDGTFGIIAGHRRHGALTKLIADGRIAVGAVPCMLRTALVDSDRVEMMLIENMQRSDLNPVEEAKAFLRLTKEFGYRQNELAVRVMRSPSYISARLALLALPETALAMVGRNELGVELAGKLAQVGDTAAIDKLTHKGTQAPRPEEITAVAKTVKVNALAKIFKDRLAGLGVEVTQERGDPSGDKLLATWTEPDDFERIVPKIPKTAKAYLLINPYSGTVTAVLRRPMTDAEKAKAAEAQANAREKMSVAWREEQETKSRTEREGWTPEYRQWKDDCAALDEAYNHAHAEYIDNKLAATEAWIDSVTVKEAARWAMLTVANSGDQWAAARWFDLDMAGGPEIAVAEFASSSAVNLVRLVAFTVLDDNERPFKDPDDSLNRFLRASDVIEPPKTVYPRYVGADDTSGETGPLGEGEREAIEDEMQTVSSYDPDEEIAEAEVISIHRVVDEASEAYRDAAAR